MTKKLRNVGNSSALILDRALMELIGLQENGNVQLTVRNGSLIMTPAHPRPVTRDQFDRALDKVVSRRRSALQRLAE